MITANPGILPSKKIIGWDQDLSHILVRSKKYLCPWYGFYRWKVESCSYGLSYHVPFLATNSASPGQMVKIRKMKKSRVLPAVTSSSRFTVMEEHFLTYLCWSDAYRIVMGGFDHLGNTWRFPIPPSYQPYTISMNNCLEFVASIITVW